MMGSSQPQRGRPERPLAPPFGRGAYGERPQVRGFRRNACS